MAIEKLKIQEVMPLISKFFRETIITKINEVVDRSNSIPAHYTYSARLAQSGVSAPTATVAYSDLPTTVTYGRVSDGEYSISLGGQYGVNKIFVYVTPKDAFAITQPIFGATMSGGGIYLTSYDPAGAVLADLIDGASITIFVYK